MAHDSNTNGNHDARGRFTAGNKAGRGNPHHLRVAELRAKMLERVTPDDVAAVVEALVNKAKSGDTAAGWHGRAVRLDPDAERVASKRRRACQ